MTGKTHKEYSLLFAYMSIILISYYGISEINYYFVLIIMVLVAREGAKFPDYDHEWNFITPKTACTKCINTFIHLTGGTHRSKHTHSIDILVAFVALSINLPNWLYKANIMDKLNKELLFIVLISFASGWISHMFSDMLNGVGVYLFWFCNIKIALVPKQLFGLKFNTGDDWEEFNYKIISDVNKVMSIIVLAYPVIERGISV